MDKREQVARVVHGLHTTIPWEEMDSPYQRKVCYSDAVQDIMDIMEEAN